MAKRSIDKRVLNVLLEAVRGALSHMREYTATLMEQGLDAPAGMAKQYTGARRLHDYLLNCAKSYRSPQEIELTEEEGNLLASCIAHRLADVEQYQEESESESTEGEWLLERRDILVWLAHRLMTRDLERIPHPNPIEREFSSVLGLVRYRADQGLDRTNLIPPPREEMRSDLMREVGIVPSTPGDHVTGPGQLRIYRGLDEVVKHTTQKSPGESSITGPVPRAPTNVLFECERLRDYKLRAFAAKDLADYATARAEGNVRLSLLHLGALIEVVVLDHFLPRREESGLDKPPSHWDYRGLALQLLGDRAYSEDGAILGRLLDIGDWLRPSRQLMEPVVLTPLMVEEAKDLLSRLLSCSGLQRGDTEESGAEVPHFEENAPEPARSRLWRPSRPRE